MKQKIFNRTATRQWGPLSLSELERAIASGRISEQDAIWHHYHRQWVRLSEVPSFRPLFDAKKPRRHTRVIAVGGSKGGVGKTAITAALSVELSRAGKKVVAVDADFGAPDLHDWLGVTAPEKTIVDYFSRPGLSLDKVRVPTNYAGLSLIAGKTVSLRYPNPLYSQRQRIMRDIQKLQADFVLIDLGPGASYQNIDIFLNADESLIVTTSEPLTILDTFNFVKVAYLRQFKNISVQAKDATKVIDEFESYALNHDQISLIRLASHIEGIDPETAHLLKNALQSLKPKIVLNMVFDDREIKDGFMLQKIIERKLGGNAEFMGFIRFSSKLRSVPQSQKLDILLESGTQELSSGPFPTQQSIGKKFKEFFISRPEVAKVFMNRKIFSAHL